MSIDPIADTGARSVAFLPPAGQIDPLGQAQGGPSSGMARATDAAGLSFADWLGAQVKGANGKLIESEQALQALATGDTANLHHVMISLEEARLGFQLITQVRSRLLESYQEVMRMQL